MKKLRILSLILVFMLVFAGCKSTKNDNANKIVTKADLTHNAVEDKIVTCIDGADKGEAYVKVFTKYNDEYTLIWKDIVGTQEADQKGIYISLLNNRFNLFSWRPIYKGDTTTLEFAIFHFTLNEEKTSYLVNEVDADSITFTSEDTKKDSKRYEEISDFVYEINHYIKKSAALIDTVGGEVVYSPNTQETVYKTYYPEWYDKEYISYNLIEEFQSAQDGWD